MKEHNKTSELNDEEITSLFDGEFKALVINMLTDLIELGRKMKKQMKDTQNKIKQKIQGTNSDRKKIRNQSNNLKQKGKINIQPEQPGQCAKRKKYSPNERIEQNFRKRAKR